MPCQAACASGRAGHRQPQESPVILLQPLDFLPKPQHVSLEGAILCPGHVGSEQRRKGIQQEVGKQKQPVPCGS